MTGAASAVISAMKEPWGGLGGGLVSPLRSKAWPRPVIIIFLDAALLDSSHNRSSSANQRYRAGYRIRSPFPLKWVTASVGAITAKSSGRDDGDALALRVCWAAVMNFVAQAKYGSVC
jgi:hypothetical protein